VVGIKGLDVTGRGVRWHGRCTAGFTENMQYETSVC